MSQRMQYRQMITVVGLLFVGLVGIYGMAGRLQTYRTVDVLRLLASGACFGAALVALVNFFRGQRGGA